jgi:undecaprenyl-diphosphatase
MSILEAILLGAIEGVTEFLPISSTGHLTVAEEALGFEVDAPDVTAFTAIIQVGAILAVILYFRHDLRRTGGAFLAGLTDRSMRSEHEYRYALALIAGSLPIMFVGLALRDVIEGPLRSLWVVGGALVVWSFVMWFVDRAATQARHEGDVTMRDTVIIGVTQCLALVPGVSRSGATMSAGLLLGLDRVAVTRLSFFLSIPALVAAALFQLATEFEEIERGIGWGPTLVGTVVSFVVAYGAVAWLLRYIARHTFALFILYRLAIGTLVLALVAAGTLAAT